MHFPLLLSKVYAGLVGLTCGYWGMTSPMLPYEPARRGLESAATANNEGCQAYTHDWQLQNLAFQAWRLGRHGYIVGNSPGLVPAER